MPAAWRRALADIETASHINAKAAKYASRSSSARDGSRGRIQRMSWATQKRMTQPKPHASALVVPCGMPAARTSADSAHMARVAWGLVGLMAYGESSLMRRSASSRAAARRAAAADVGCGEPRLSFGNSESRLVGRPCGSGVGLAKYAT